MSQIPPLPRPRASSEPTSLNRTPSAPDAVAARPRAASSGAVRIGPAAPPLDPPPQAVRQVPAVPEAAAMPALAAPPAQGVPEAPVADGPGHPLVDAGGGISDEELRSLVRWELPPGDTKVGREILLALLEPANVAVAFQPMRGLGMGFGVTPVPVEAQGPALPDDTKGKGSR